MNFPIIKGGVIVELLRISIIFLVEVIALCIPFRNQQDDVQDERLVPLTILMIFVFVFIDFGYIF